MTQESRQEIKGAFPPRPAVQEAEVLPTGRASVGHLLAMCGNGARLFHARAGNPLRAALPGDLGEPIVARLGYWPGYGRFAVVDARMREESARLSSVANILRGLPAGEAPWQETLFFRHGPAGRPTRVMYLDRLERPGLQVMEPGSVSIARVGEAWVVLSRQMVSLLRPGGELIPRALGHVGLEGTPVAVCRGVDPDTIVITSCVSGKGYRVAALTERRQCLERVETGTHIDKMADNEYLVAPVVHGDEHGLILENPDHDSGSEDPDRRLPFVRLQDLEVPFIDHTEPPGSDERPRMSGQVASMAAHRSGG